MDSDTGIGNLILDVDLADSTSIANASRILHDLPNRIERARLNAIKELQDRVLDRLKREIAMLGLAGSSIAKSIRIDNEPDGFMIVIDNDHAMYVEFGTGIVGKGATHPNWKESGWDYDSKKHGESGWWYPTTKDDPNPTKYYSATSDTMWAWTKGLESRPFMYNTWRYARLITTKTFNKHLRRELVK